MSKLFLLRNLHGKILFSGHYPSFGACLEDAINHDKALRFLDLRHSDLRHCNLDGAILPHADFSHANLTGCNLSEATLDGSRFQQADLYNCCLAQSS